LRPSGENTGVSIPLDAISVYRGSTSPDPFRGANSQPSIAQANARAASAAHLPIFFRFPPGGTGRCAAIVEDSAIVRSANARSSADWNRCDGSFSRQCRMVARRLAGVDSGSGSGSFSKMAAMMLVVLLPSKAWRPESIS